LLSTVGQERFDSVKHYTRQFHCRLEALRQDGVIDTVKSGRHVKQVQQLM